MVSSPFWNPRRSTANKRGGGACDRRQQERAWARSSPRRPPPPAIGSNRVRMKPDNNFVPFGGSSLTCTGWTCCDKVAISAAGRQVSRVDYLNRQTKDAFAKRFDLDILDANTGQPFRHLEQKIAMPFRERIELRLRRVESDKGLEAARFSTFLPGKSGCSIGFQSTKPAIPSRLNQSSAVRIIQARTCHRPVCCRRICRRPASGRRRAAFGGLASGFESGFVSGLCGLAVFRILRRNPPSAGDQRPAAKMKVRPAPSDPRP